MGKIDKKIKITDIEEITLQAETLSGLSHVCAMYLDHTGENSFLKNALECLSDEANEHQKYCNLLLENLIK